MSQPLHAPGGHGREFPHNKPRIRETNVTEASINAKRRRELGLFLRNRRARVRPEDVGLVPGSGHRRVLGLRREEVAVLAGAGVRWYTMLENGTADGVSAATLNAIARALLLTHDETDYIHNLGDPDMDGTPDDRVAPLALGAFAAIEWAPAYVCTAQWIVLAWNRAMTLVWDIEPPGGPPFNIVRRMFLDARMRSLHGDGFAELGAGLCRWCARERDGWRTIRCTAACTLISGDPIFAAAWDAYDVSAPFGSYRTTIISPAVGEFVYEAFSLPLRGDAGQSIVVQVPENPSGDRLRAALERRESGRTVRPER